ncbi:MAG: hypothetical protein Q7J82_02415 [Coriobacteriia bacterium]|nr:hypothetical protein [Coriobacteriia bacterium]
MGSHDGSKNWSRAGAWSYALLSVLVLLALVIVLQLWRADWSVPLGYSGDAVTVSAVTKGMAETGSWLTNPQLGAPGSLSMLDYPGTDLLNNLALYLLTFVTRSWVIALNVFYLLSYPLAAISCFYALQRLSVSRWAAFFSAVLYAFLPYHLYRGETHLYLSAYYLVPLVALIAIELMAAESPLIVSPGLRWRSTHVRWAVIVCVLLGASGVYYAYFGCFFLALAGARGWWRTGEARRLRLMAVLLATVVVTAGLSLSPYLVHRLNTQPNLSVAQRGATETEYYGLKITQMILPVHHHRIVVLASVRERYVDALVKMFGGRMDNEADAATLGVVGVIGMMYMLLALLFGKRGEGGKATRSEVVTSAAVLLVAGLLLATTSGFGTIVGFLLPQIRAYNRIVVYLAFFALFGAAVLFDKVTSKVPPARQRILLPLLVLFLMVVGVADQTTSASIPDYAHTRTDWATLGEFVGRVEARVPRDAMVFQLPYVPFPENPPVVAMKDYDHFKPYLQSTKIHWSYGAMKGREDSIWQQNVAALPVTQMVAMLRERGFAGVWVDRVGYTDGAAAIEAEIAAASGVQVMSSSDGRYAFFALDE